MVKRTWLDLNINYYAIINDLIGNVPICGLARSFKYSIIKCFIKMLGTATDLSLKTLQGHL